MSAWAITVVGVFVASQTTPAPSIKLAAVGLTNSGLSDERAAYFSEHFAVKLAGDPAFSVFTRKDLTTTATAELNAVWGSSAADIWAVGAAGALAHWTGASWANASGSTASLNGVWGSGSSDIWAVGASGTLLHWNGSSWASVSSGTTNPLNALTGTSASSIWLVGVGGTILAGP